MGNHEINALGLEALRRRGSGRSTFANITGATPGRFSGYAGQFAACRMSGTTFLDWF